MDAHDPKLASLLGDKIPCDLMDSVNWEDKKAIFPQGARVMDAVLNLFRP